MEDGRVACSNVNELTAALNINYNPSEWRLFIDSSKSSLKAVLLHNGNIFGSMVEWLKHWDHDQHGLSSKNLLRPFCCVFGNDT